MIDKIWWYFEDFVYFVARLFKGSKYGPIKRNQADQCIAITRDGKVYVGKGLQGEVKNNTLR